MKPLNRKSVVAKFVTHASAHSTYLINGFIFMASALMHSTCTRKPTESHQTLPSPGVILKAIRAGVGWVWLARLEDSRDMKQPEAGTSRVKGNVGASFETYCYDECSTTFNSCGDVS